MTQQYVSRRRVIAAVGGVGVTTLAGCSGGDGEVVVGADGSLAFDPETLTVSSGATVTWRFEGQGHNVSCRPDHHDGVTLPDDAQPFASYEGDDQFATMAEGATFSHAFDVAGTYEYVCVPHASSGMTGTVRVED